MNSNFVLTVIIVMLKGSIAATHTTSVKIIHKLSQFLHSDTIHVAVSNMLLYKLRAQLLIPINIIVQNTFN